MSAAAACKTLPPFVAGTIVKVPLRQHLGAAATATVASGDIVLRGQRIGAAQGAVSAHVHAPTSGRVVTIEENAPGAAGRSVPHVVIEADGLDGRCQPFAPWADWQDKDAATLAGRIAEAGVVGMGGAGFPTHVKLGTKKVDTLIINGAECEPYLTSDHRAMLEHPAEIIEGAHILRHILGAKTLRFAIEENKPDAIDLLASQPFSLSAFQPDCDGDVAIAVLKAMYPQGSEKQQIYAITGRAVPDSGLPMDVGCLVENVGTVLAVYNAIVKGLPLDERIVTVTGPAIAHPCNILARIGTSYRTLIEAAGGLDHAVKVISGGPMMGFAQYTLDIAVTKTTSGILALRAQDCSAYASCPCIACGRCNAVCPMRLLPSEMSQRIEADDIAEAQKLRLTTCFECGACSYACPARRPLVQHFRRAKAALALHKNRYRTGR
ncbi:MAG: electron transport complex subunit RsxC [Kiritimatiellaeota bacterium]|nr:electron transport complex subunit RsxC [Kiritimatiellota bacterium]